jgi:hypothetical protein
MTAVEELDKIADQIRYHGRLDFVCPACGAEQKDIRAPWLPVPEETRTYKGEEIRLPVLCVSCNAEMDPVPAKQYRSLLSENIQFDLGDGPKRYSSLSEIRAVEAESHKKARDGIGSAIAVRAFNQNASNKDVNSLKGSEFERERQIPVEKFAGKQKKLKISGGATRKPV